MHHAIISREKGSDGGLDMFCLNCGNEIPLGIKYCASCGNPVEPSSAPKVKLVAAKCMFCGGNLKVNPTMEKSICPFCDAEYIVEKAINYYNIQTHQVNLTASNIVINNASTSDNLLTRGDEAFNNTEFLKALYYYEQALDYDPKNEAIRYRKNLLQYPLLTSWNRFSCSLTKISFSNATLQSLRATGNPHSIVKPEMNFKSIAWDFSIGAVVLTAEDSNRFALPPYMNGIEIALTKSFSIFRTRRGILWDSLNRQGISGIKSYYMQIFWLPTGAIFLTDKAIVVYDQKWFAIIPFHMIESVDSEKGFQSYKVNIKGHVYYYILKNSGMIPTQYNSCALSFPKDVAPDYLKCIESAMSGKLGNPVGMIYVL